MTINEQYKLRQLSKTGYVLESQEKGKLVVLNETAAFIWNALKSGSISFEELHQAITEKYRVDEKTALNDLSKTLSQWQSIGIIHP